MSNLLRSRAAKFISVFVAVVMIVGVVAPASVNAQSLTESQIQSILDLLSSFGADQATIDNVDGALRGEATSGTGSTGGSSSVCPYTWSRNLQIGDRGDDVMKLQQFLNDELSSPLASSGAGSPGNETSYYGSITAAGVKRFQEKYSGDVLAPVGLSSGTNFFWPSTRAKANELCESAPSDTGDDDDQTSTPTGSASIVSVSQPDNELFPLGSSRVPFTKFAISAGAEDVTLNDVTVERVGNGSNDAFSSVMLVNGDLSQIGNRKTLNSNNQAVIGDDFVVEAGTTDTFTVVGNAPTASASNDGEQLKLNVVDIDTDANLSASYPITGAQHTVNESLSIGSATMSRGATDPGNSSPTKDIGTDGYTFSSVKITAGSAEKIRLMSVRWDQAGTAASEDLENVRVVVGGTSYDATLASDGDHYSAVFGNGIVLDKGLSKDIELKADIADGANRTVTFDLEHDTDVYVTGETFGYGIVPTIGGNNDSDTSSDDSEFNDGTNDGGTPPFYDGDDITINAGTLTVSASSAVPAGTVANGADDVNLGSFKFNVKGEAISWSEIDINISTDGGSSDESITNVTLVDANGNTLAGPQDPDGSGSPAVLSDSVTLEAGEHILYVRGNLDNDWDDGDTIQVRIPTSNIDSITGEVSGQSITASPSSTVNGKTQTVGAGSLTVSPSTAFGGGNIIGDTSEVKLGQFIIDATGSGEDLDVTVAKVEGRTGSNASLDELNTLALYDESGTQLTTGSNAVDPTESDAGDETLTFTFDDAFTVAKGTSVKLVLRGNVATDAGDATSNSTYRFDFAGSFDTTNDDWSVTGADTGISISPSYTTGSSISGQTTLVGSGSFSARLAPSSPSEEWYLSGEEATVGIIGLTGSNEDINLTDLGLREPLSTTTAADWAALRVYEEGSNTPFIDQEPAWTSGTQTFSSIPSGDFTIKRGTETDLIIKAVFADIGSATEGFGVTQSGNILQVGTTTVRTDLAGTGVDSGTVINVDAANSVGTSTGARYFKALPKVEEGTQPTSLSNSNNLKLYEFKVTAQGGDVGIGQFTFTFATGTASITNVDLVDSNSDIVNTVSEVNVDDGADFAITVQNSYSTDNIVTIAEGATETFTLRADVENTGSDSYIITDLVGDTAEAEFGTFDGGTHALGRTLSDVQGQATASDNFIWSPFSTSSTPTTSDYDWFNSLDVSGLEGNNLGTNRID